MSGSRIAVFGAGYAGARHGGLLRRARPLRCDQGHRPREDRGAERGRASDLRARPRRAGRAKPGAPHVHARRSRGRRGLAVRLHLRRHAPDVRRRRRPVARLDRDRGAASDVDADDPGDEEHRSCRYRRDDPGEPERARARERRLRVEPRVPRRGNGAQGLPRARSDRRRRFRGIRRGRGRGAARRTERTRRAHRRRLRGDGQARVERLPRNAHQLHQRNRQRVRARGRGRHGRRARDGPGFQDRDALPEARHRVRRELLSERHFVPQVARGQLGLSLSAAQLRDRGERAAETARDRKLQKHLGSLRDAAIALLGLAFKAQTDDLREAPSIVLASRPARRRRGRARVGSRGRRQPGPARRQLRLEHRGGGRRRGRGSDRHRVGRAARARLSGDSLRDAHAAHHRRAQPARPGRGARRRLRLRGHRPCQLPLDLLPETAEPDLPAPAREE